MKKTELLSISLYFIFSLLITGCESEDNEPVCRRFVSPECATLDFNTCSDDKGDYYEYDGSKYYCKDYFVAGDSDECGGAAEKLVSETNCVASSAATMKSGALSYKSFVLDAMSKVRSETILAAGCN